MIIYKQWKKLKPGRGDKYLTENFYTFEGWFLFGFIPLYIRRIGVA